MRLSNIFWLAFNAGFAALHLGSIYTDTAGMWTVPALVCHAVFFGIHLSGLVQDLIEARA